MVSFSKLLDAFSKQVPVKSRNGKIIVAAAVVSCALAAASTMPAGKKKGLEKSQSGANLSKALHSKKERVAVDTVFFKRFAKLFKVIVPGWKSAEAGWIVVVAAMLAARTFCDLWVIKIGSTIERTIVTQRPDLFKHHMIRFFMGMVPCSLLNCILKFGLQETTLRFRVNLTGFLMNKYLKGYTYYRLVNLDSRVSNPDQLLTQDVEKFCAGVTDMYQNVSKPLLDSVIYTAKLSRAIGIQGPSLMLVYLALSGIVLTNLRRPLGKLTVEEQRLEGEYRAVNARLITNSEEIAFYGGNDRERDTIRGSFRRLVAHLRKIMSFRFAMGFFDNVVTKYIATMVGFLILQKAFLGFRNKAGSVSADKIMEDYYKSARMLVNLAGAVGRLVLAGRDLTRLAGFTARVTELVTVFDDLGRGDYQRTMVHQSAEEVSTAASSDEQPLIAGAGTVIEQDGIIKFDHVPVVTPNGDMLLKDLTFEVHSGTNVLVAGPNGCGKSSLFRILGELWPIFGGVLTKPNRSKLFYVPQRPYLTLGTLRDQIIYPHSVAQFKARGGTDEQLADLLAQVHLSHLVEREKGGWDSVQDWMDVLSGGEKQRVAMARMFYHKPQFAILDECTSAVSVDVEGFMYDNCRKQGITLFTVSHRKSLWKFHEYVLMFDGLGGYKYEKIDHENSAVFGS